MVGGGGLTIKRRPLMLCINGLSCYVLVCTLGKQYKYDGLRMLQVNRADLGWQLRLCYILCFAQKTTILIKVQITRFLICHLRLNTYLVQNS